MGRTIVTFDEASFRLVPIYKKVWFFRGKTPEGVFFWSNKKLNVFGALVDGKKLFYEFYDSLNSFMFLSFVHRLMKTLSKRKKYVFVLDNAPFHKSSVVKKRLASLGKNIAVEFLPTYSPELNPTETCWKVIRHNVTNSTFFPTLKEMAENIESFIRGHNFELNVSNYLCR